jgi:hypothetical protein
MNIGFKYNAEELAKRILAELWKRKVLNAIALIPLTNTSQSNGATGRRTSADVLEMEASALGIYTWYPYRGPNRCSVVDEAVLLDIWLMEGEGKFARNLFLFPNKLSDNFHGCEVRVATKITKFSVESKIQNSTNSTNITLYSGFEIELLNLITRTANLTPILLPQMKNFRQRQEESGKYTGYTGRLINDEADIALGGIIRTATSTDLMDVSTSYREIRYVWYVPCPVKFPGWKSIFRIFSLSGWLSIILAATLAVVVTVFLARFAVKEYESFRHFMNAILDVWALILGVSVSSLPRSTPLRLFFTAWVCYSLAINTVFQAYLTTFLVDPGFERSITSVEEVFTSGTKYGFSSIFFDHNFNDTTDPKAVEILENRIDCRDFVTCVLWTAKYRNISSIVSQYSVGYMYHGSKHSDEFRGHEPCGLTEAPVLVTDILMALQKGSPLLDRVNEITARLVESGIPTYLEKFEPGGKLVFNPKSNTSNTIADEYSILTMKNMQPAFCLFLFGQALALVTFLMELLCLKFHR